MRRTYILATLATVISGCSQAPREPYVVSDINIDKAGFSKSISFSVPPDGRDVNRGLMIGLDFPSGNGDAADAIVALEPPVRLSIDEILPSGRRPVPTSDYHTTLERNGHPLPLRSTALHASPTDVRLSLYASGFGESHVLVARFPAKPGGHYEATITTVADLPAFHDVPVRLVADDLYNTGK